MLKTDHKHIIQLSRSRSMRKKKKMSRTGRLEVLARETLTFYIGLQGGIR